MRAELVPAFFAELDAWSGARGVPVETVAYGPEPDQFLELRGPAPSGTGRLALVLHGGFWRAGYTCHNTAAVATALAEAGWTTANVEYRRLGPGFYLPLLEDVLAARRHLDEEAAVVAVGHSAGGHLALWLAASGAVDGAVALGGVCDLAAAARANLGAGAVQELLGGGPSEAPEAYTEADPAARLPLGRPQVLVHGVNDDRVPIDHARGYAARATAAGDDCRVVEVDAGHFELIDPRSPVWPAVVAAVEAAVGSEAVAAK
jgi:acetyl esterase/lipase